MSLDVKVIYKRPVREKYWDTHRSCGSTVLLCGEDHEEEVSEWSANITHNMTKMAKNVPVSYAVDGEWYEGDLYQMVWRPDDVGDGEKCLNTTVMAYALRSGIAYMVCHRDSLERFNPDNGWGNYDMFLDWLIAYWRTCMRHPDCRIEVDG